VANKISVAKNTSIDLPARIAGAEFAHQDIGCPVILEYRLSLLGADESWQSAG
jgi:hypothetical protein